MPPFLRARALLEAAEVYSSVKAKRARGYAEQSVQLFRELGDHFMLYRALARLARLAAPDDAPAALAALAEVRELEDAPWPARQLLSGAGAEQACVSWFHDPQKGIAYGYRLMGLEREA